jgi:hypothetical protein
MNTPVIPDQAIAGPGVNAMLWLTMVIDVGGAPGAASRGSDIPFAMLQRCPRCIAHRAGGRQALAQQPSFRSDNMVRQAKCVLLPLICVDGHGGCVSMKLKTLVCSA